MMLPSLGLPESKQAQRPLKTLQMQNMFNTTCFCLGLLFGLIIFWTNVFSHCKSSVKESLTEAINHCLFSLKGDNSLLYYDIFLQGNAISFPWLQNTSSYFHAARQRLKLCDPQLQIPFIFILLFRTAKIYFFLCH